MQVPGLAARMSRLPRPPARVAFWLFLLIVGLAAAQSATAAGFDPSAETEKLLATLPAEARAKSDAYFEGGYWLQLWNLVLALALAWAVLRFGVAQKIRDFAEKKFQRRFAQGWLFLVVFSLVMWALNLPMDFYEGFIREHQYGMSNQNFGAWMGDNLKGLLVSLVLLPPIVSLLYLGIRSSPQRWWVRAGIATPFFMILFLVIAPVFIAPLFNKYTPLTDAKVRDPILSMARANSVPAENVYQFDASRQTKRISANVSGALGTIRVSLNDNLLNRCTPAEVQAVMGHELGHYVLNHIYKHVLSLSVLFITGFWFTHWFFGVLHRRWGATAGVRDIADFAGLPLISASLGVFMFFATPVRNTIIRTAEQEADVFGLNAARQPDGFASTALKLAEYRKLKPGPWEEKIFYDHPSGYTRILTAMRWKAEHLAELNAAAPAPKP